VERDLAFVAPKSLPHQKIMDTLAQLNLQTLKSTMLFDVYEGKGLPENHRSMAYRFILQAPDRTLTDQEILETMGQIQDKLASQLQLQLR
jgi:phenylalanyl-tRNA synthetase beta chain